MPQNNAYVKPVKVVRAVYILYLTVAIGLARKIMLLMRHADVRSPDFLIYTALFLLSISLFLIYQAGKGRNWARWSLVWILCISIPLTILPMFQGLSHTLIPNILGLTQVVLFLISLMLLFHKNTSSWFRRKKVSKDKRNK